MFILCKFIGNIGEKYAEKFLKRCGYTIVARQYRASFVEIDILAHKGKTLYVFEVKSVSHRNIDHSPFYPLYRVRPQKIRKMGRFVDYYLNSHSQYTGVAMGVIVVVLSDKLKKPKIEIVWI